MEDFIKSENLISLEKEITRSILNVRLFMLNCSKKSYVFSNCFIRGNGD